MARHSRTPARYARRVRLLVIAAIAAGCGESERVEGPAGGPPATECNSWRQWGNNAAHDGASCVSGQPLHGMLSDMVYDPFLAQEVADADGDLLVHYQAPLIDGDDVYMMTKRGAYTPCNVGSDGPSCFDPDELYRLRSQIWSEQRFVLRADGVLIAQWTFDSDWKPEPQIGFEPLFQPALAGALIAIPGAGGALWELDRITGAVVRHVAPFGAIDHDTYVAGGIAVGADGTLYYNAIKLDHDAPLVSASQAWLVAVAPDGTVRTADYAELALDAPAADDSCFRTYLQQTPLPWPPIPPRPAPRGPCGPQRPGLNATPAVAADGTIFTVSRAHNNPRYSYVVAIAPDLTPRWATSLRDHLNDGCGVTTPSDATATEHPFDCRIGAPVGVERATGLAPAGQVDDQSSSSPVALPDGGVLYGSYTGYNTSRGHLFKLDANGAIVATYDFGWDSTPAVVGDAAGYRIIIKDNHYETDEYGNQLGPFYITALDEALRPIWKFQSTNMFSCTRQPDATITCSGDHPGGFEWCINAVAVDRDGTVYANSEDGNVYAIAADGTLRDWVFLDRAIGAAYTPIALDRNGHVFALNSGHLSVIGR
jgi:outer membrane protein assembly factor BamB